MGFPIGYSVGIVGLLSRLLLNSLSLFHFITYRILTLLRFEPGIARAGSSGSARPGSIPARLIREILPAEKFSEVAGAGGYETPEVCAVCLCSFHGEEEIRRLRICKHVFHKGCLDRWMEYERMTCPLCRTPLVSVEMQEVFSKRPWGWLLSV